MARGPGDRCLLRFSCFYWPFSRHSHVPLAFPPPKFSDKYLKKWYPLPACHLITRGYAEYICLFERLLPATGIPQYAASGTTCECVRQKSAALDDECLTPA